MNKNTQKTMFSSKSDEWYTPEDFYKSLNERFGFTLDPCADAVNAKCSKYYSKQDNGLMKNWEGETVFVNPPYTRGAIKQWVEKCYSEAQKENTKVVCLIPARTDTKYWHSYCMKAKEIYFVEGRLKFGGPGAGGNAAPFPSAVVVFDGKPEQTPEIKKITRKGILAN